ncbi:hypothetical protein [Bradyrhizobium sp. SZCCHNRI1073]|uniref:hypothetical protein n=1 Tax=Bradyrhizobium sp. SZCCHNRI1073 TaxID=3057280 RepID=UPI00291683FF|nr:hypothetical protein [Bradyrhizobium sp. SZCCHNRI1073]
MSGDSQKLLELAERCEKAERPDRGLDAEIHFRIKNGIGVGCASDAPAFTGSLDAALTLVPEGLSWTTGQNVHHLYWHTGVNRLNLGTGAPESVSCSAPTKSPALALCAAALRARAAIAKKTSKG